MDNQNPEQKMTLISDEITALLLGKFTPQEQTLIIERVINSVNEKRVNKIGELAKQKEEIISNIEVLENELRKTKLVNLAEIPSGPY